MSTHLEWSDRRDRTNIEARPSELLSGARPCQRIFQSCWAGAVKGNTIMGWEGCAKEGLRAKERLRQKEWEKWQGRLLFNEAKTATTNMLVPGMWHTHTNTQTQCMHGMESCGTLSSQGWETLTSKQMPDFTSLGFPRCSCQISNPSPVTCFTGQGQGHSWDSCSQLVWDDLSWCFWVLLKTIRDAGMSTVAIYRDYRDLRTWSFPFSAWLQKIRCSQYQTHQPSQIDQVNFATSLIIHGLLLWGALLQKTQIRQTFCVMHCTRLLVLLSFVESNCCTPLWCVPPCHPLDRKLHPSMLSKMQ